MTNAMQEHLFADLKVLDLASFIAGPAATTILSDFGADVIKVEPPGRGDPYRYFFSTPPNPQSASNYSWQLTNRNKRSLALNLKSPESREVLKRLVKWADVLVTNFPPETRKKLGLRYEDVSGHNDQLIYADVTGYGSKGNDADKPGFDVTAYWARTGLMEVTHDADSAPTLPIPGIGDHATAVTLYSAIVTGLFRRLKFGKGCHVTTSLIAEGAWAAGTWIEGALHGAKFFPQHDRKRPPNALLNPYLTSDGRWILLVAAQEKDWPGFVSAMNLPALLSDPRFIDKKNRAKNATALVDILDTSFSKRPLAYWVETFDKGHVIFGVVQQFDEIIRDPQMYANDIIVPLETAVGDISHTVNSTMQIVDSKKVRPRAAPNLGQHSESVLRELFFSELEISAMRSSGVIESAITQ